MLNLSRRPLGKLLVDSKLLSPHDLETALKNQKGTKELLGQALVKMGVLTPPEVDIALHLQGHLNHIEDAVKVAAGEHRLLGTLLVESGQISSGQLDHAIAEQKRSGERLGEVFVRLGLLTRRQLTALLDFQQSQDATSESPLRLGELLVATGHISREQLEHALGQQAQTHGKLGEILVADGYIRPREIRRGLRLQKKLLSAVLAAVLSLSMSSVSSASSVTLQWDQLTSETDLVGYRVYYATAGSDPIQNGIAVDMQNQTTATISDLDPVQTYDFAVTGYDSNGVETLYSNVVNVVEHSLPIVAITSPGNNSSVSGTVSLIMNASDNVGVTRIELYIDGLLTAVETAAPCTYPWDTSELAPGAHTIMAKTYDAAGNVGQSDTITVNVNNDFIAPTIAVTAPTDNAIVSGVLTVSADAYDNVGVTQVDFYCNDVLLHTSTGAPHSFDWDTTQVSNGLFAITANARDATGNVTLSRAVTVTVSNLAPDTTAPTFLSFALPSISSSLTVPISSLSASDTVGVTGYLVSESPTTPSATDSRWSSGTPTSLTFGTQGSKTAYAWAKDAAGNISAAKTASVQIILPDSTAPTIVTFTVPSAAKTLTVPVSSLSATDDTGVTGYLISESSTPPLANDARWSKTAPVSFTFSSGGTKTIYAWAKDAAGNISKSVKATVKLNVK